MNRLLLFSLFTFLLLAGCKKDPVTPACEIGPGTGERVFEFVHRSTGLTYVAWTSDAAVIQQVEAQLALPLDQRNQHINGAILRKPEGCSINAPWSWYFAPNDWTVAPISIELCDGNPEYVEDNVDEYVDVVKRYCPWSSVVSREVVD